MAGHTVVVISADLGLDSCGEFSEMLGVPVSAFYVADGAGHGSGKSNVPQRTCQEIADTVRDLFHLIARGSCPPGETVEERHWWVATQVASIVLCAAEAEHAAACKDEQRMFETAEKLRVLSVAYVAGLRAHEAQRE
jgi:hypothetical protein